MDRPSDTVIVFTRGDPVVADALGDLPRDAYVIAADSGLDHARRLGWAGRGGRRRLRLGHPRGRRRQPGRRHRHRGPPPGQGPHRLRAGPESRLALHPRRIVVVGGQGGRLDHLLANALTLSGPARAGSDVDVVSGTGRLHVVTPTAAVSPAGPVR